MSWLSWPQGKSPPWHMGGMCCELPHGPVSSKLTVGSCFLCLGQTSGATDWVNSDSHMAKNALWFYSFLLLFYCFAEILKLSVEFFFLFLYFLGPLLIFQTVIWTRTSINTVYTIVDYQQLRCFSPRHLLPYLTTIQKSQGITLQIMIYNDMILI